MRLILRFLKPHWKLCMITILLMITDVAGALFIPTLAAKMLNAATAGSGFGMLGSIGVKMAAASIISGGCAILGGYSCAALSSRLGRDMRVALYVKSLSLSVYDFRRFGSRDHDILSCLWISSCSLSTLSYFKSTKSY